MHFVPRSLLKVFIGSTLALTSSRDKASTALFKIKPSGGEEDKRGGPGGRGGGPLKKSLSSQGTFDFEMPFDDDLERDDGARIQWDRTHWEDGRPRTPGSGKTESDNRLSESATEDVDPKHALNALSRDLKRQSATMLDVSDLEIRSMQKEMEDACSMYQKKISVAGISTYRTDGPHRLQAYLTLGMAAGMTREKEYEKAYEVLKMSPERRQGEMVAFSDADLKRRVTYTIEQQQKKLDVLRGGHERREKFAERMAATYGHFRSGHFRAAVEAGKILNKQVNPAQRRKTFKIDNDRMKAALEVQRGGGLPPELLLGAGGDSGETGLMRGLSPTSAKPSAQQQLIGSGVPSPAGGAGSSPQSSPKGGAPGSKSMGPSPKGSSPKGRGGEQNATIAYAVLDSSDEEGGACAVGSPTSPLTPAGGRKSFFAAQTIPFVEKSPESSRPGSSHSNRPVAAPSLDRAGAVPPRPQSGTSRSEDALSPFEKMAKEMIHGPAGEFDHHEFRDMEIDRPIEWEKGEAMLDRAMERKDRIRPTCLPRQPPFERGWGKTALKAACRQSENLSVDMEDMELYADMCQLTHVKPNMSMVREVLKTRFNAIGQDLTDNDLLALSVLIQRRPIVYLDLTGNACVTDRGLIELLQKLTAKGAPAQQSMCCFRLGSMMGIEDLGLGVLTRAVERFSNLQELNLSHIHALAPNTLLDLAEILGEKTMKIINMVDTRIPIELGTEVLQLILDNPMLKRLDFGWNVLHADTFDALRPKLIDHPGLRYLSIPNCTMAVLDRDEFHPMNLFLEGLRDYDSLRYLDVSMNFLNEKSAVILEAALYDNANLLELFIDENPLGPQGCRALLRALTSQETELEYVSVSSMYTKSQGRGRAKGGPVASGGTKYHVGTGMGRQSTTDPSNRRVGSPVRSSSSEFTFLLYAAVHLLLVVWFWK